MHKPEFLQGVMVAVSLASYILICVDGTWHQAMEMFKVTLWKLYISQICQWAELSHAKPCEYGVMAWSQLTNLLLLQAAQAKVLHEFDFIQRVQLQCSGWSVCQQDLLVADSGLQTTMSLCLLQLRSRGITLSGRLKALHPAGACTTVSYHPGSSGQVKLESIIYNFGALLCQSLWPAGRSVSWRAIRKCTACC